MKKHYRPLDLMLAATIMFRDGDPVTASRLLFAAVEHADFEEAVREVSYLQQEQLANEQLAMDDVLPEDVEEDAVIDTDLDEEQPAEEEVVDEAAEEAKLFALASKILADKRKRKTVASEKRAEMSLDKPTKTETVSRPSGKVSVTENTEVTDLPGRKEPANKETAKIIANLRQLRAKRK